MTDFKVKEYKKSFVLMLSVLWPYIVCCAGCDARNVTVMVSVSILQPVITISTDCLSSQASCQSNIWIPSTHSHACYCFRISIFSQISILSEKRKNSPSSKRKSRHSGKKLIMCVWWLEECQGICRQCRPSDHQGLCQSPSDSRSLHDPAPCM